ncbi:Phosphoglycerate mutase [Ceraceosorus bombacis]|uniref:Phosphoglycerate mutase n=1 Tax=Ceraceosorus bombacis TaxID=401625 RepID=A0A0P1BBV9_9BASI|nr:Phosphoglycerate mutase [Ceraceosorus bombacis]
MSASIIPSSTTTSSSSSRPKRLRLLVVRHGETDHNVAGIIQGQIDTDLNVIGRKQAEHVARALREENIDEVYSSPLRRARDTADAIVQAHPKLNKSAYNYWLDDRLMERGFGTLEGKKYGTPGAPKPDTIEGIEQGNDFRERLASILNDIIQGPAPWALDPLPAGTQANPQIISPCSSGYKDSTRLAPLSLSNSSASSGQHPFAPGAVAPQQESRVANIAPGGYTNRDRTVLIVGHGASISAMLGDVLLSGNYAYLAPAISRTRIWNCSICEAIVRLPLLLTDHDVQERRQVQAGHESLRRTWPIRPPHLNPPSNNPKAMGEGSIIVERWADVRHLPQQIDGEGVTNVDEEIQKAK